MPVRAFFPPTGHLWTSDVTITPSRPSEIDKVNVTVTFHFHSSPPRAVFGNVTQIGNVFSVNVTVHDDWVACAVLHDDEQTFHLGNLPAGSYQFKVYVVYELEDWPEEYFLEKQESFTVISLGPNPTADFTYSPPYPSVNETVTFDASTSEPGWNGTHFMPIVNYTWNLGDGNISTTSDPIITHKYGINITYTVTLNVTDSQGLWNTTSKTIVIYPIIHDITITNIMPSTFEAYPTWMVPLEISITVKNNGTFTENFQVTLYWNNTNVINTKTVTLNPQETKTLTYNWTIPTIPKAHPYPKYKLSANATLPDDNSPEDNSLIDGTITVKWPGDCNGDGHVDGNDLYVMAVSWHRPVGNPAYDSRADFNRDGDIDGNDLYLMAINWHKGPLD